MKHIIFILLCLTMVCGALYFHQIQQSHFNKAINLSQSLQKDLKTLEDDLHFLKHHGQDLHFLTQKGWFSPQNRLIAAEKIKQTAAFLNKLSFIFEPETTQENKNGYGFKVSKLTMEATGLLDATIYDFIQNILREFPGILVLSKLSLTRNQNSIHGEIIFEWVSMGEGKDAQ